MSERLSTAHEVAAHFGVRPGTVMDWHQAGKLPPDAVCVLGGTPRGRLRFRIDVIERAWMPGAGEETPVTSSVRPAPAIVSVVPVTSMQGEE